MPFDETAISAAARAKYVKIGRGFSSIVVLALANRHLEALGKHGAVLAEHGFGADDVVQLTDARDALETESLGRTEVQGDKKTISKGHRDALSAASHARRGARTILGAGAVALRQAGGDAAEEAARGIETVMEQTSRTPGRDGVKMAEQLDVLRAKLGEPAVAAVVANRGGPAAVARLLKAGTALRASNKQNTGSGTSEATELMDLLDGLIVTLARNARKAAVDAAQELGKPALADAFDLRELYPPKGTPEAPTPAKAAKAAAPAKAATEAAAAVEESGPSSKAA